MAALASWQLSPSSGRRPGYVTGGDSPTVEASLFHTISELVLRGMGVAVVDLLTGASHKRRGGIAIPLRPALTYTVYATAMSDTRLGAPAREMLRCLKSALDAARTHVAGE